MEETASASPRGDVPMDIRSGIALSLVHCCGVATDALYPPLVDGGGSSGNPSMTDVEIRVCIGGCAHPCLDLCVAHDVLDIHL